MPRSRGGLAAAGEWHQLRPLFPPLAGKAVLDLGCGYGWHCKYAADQGAARVLGIDASEKMLAEAARRNACPAVEYRRCGLEEYEYPAAAWDCVVSNLALHYIARPGQRLPEGVPHAETPAGPFCSTSSTRCSTAGVGQDWLYAPDGRPLCWPVDDYYRPGPRKTRFLGCEVEKQHHTLTQILMGLLDAGFALRAVVEAEPPAEMLDLPGMRDELRPPP